MGTMDTFVLLSLTMILTPHASGSESVQARGWQEEDPWQTMNQMQPEVMIVKEKGDAAASSSGMKMKDLTPVICLLAPLLLAAIMIPAKMTMMMNTMMSSPLTMMNGMNGMNMLMPPNGMMMMPPNGMMPPMLLSSGMGTSNPLGIPIFKNLLESKKFSVDSNQESDNLNKALNSSMNVESQTQFERGERDEIQIIGKPDSSRVDRGKGNFKLLDPFVFKNALTSKKFSIENEAEESSYSSSNSVSNDMEQDDGNEKSDLHSSYLSPLLTFSKQKLPTHKIFKKSKGDSKGNEWTSRIWSMESPPASVTSEIRKILADISRII